MAQNYRKREQISRSDNSSDISSFFFFFLVNVKFTEKFRLSAFTKKLKNFFHVRHVCVLFVFLFRSPQKGQDGVSVTNDSTRHFLQDYSMDCYFRQSWRDSRLSFLGPIKSLSLSIKMLERIWRPDTYFYNGKHSYVHTITVPNKLLRISQDGDILYSMRLLLMQRFHFHIKHRN